MSNPQITGRTRSGPVEALRAVFAGIGRIVMTAEKNRAPVAPEPRWRSLDQTGNVRLLTADDLDDGYAERNAAKAAPPEPQAAAAELASQVPAQRADLDQVTPPPPAATELPMASYDDLSLPSIRARLRTLDVAQLRTLVDYEATHAERQDVLGMLERRIEKLQTAG